MTIPQEFFVRLEVFFKD